MSLLGYIDVKGQRLPSCQEIPSVASGRPNSCRELVGHTASPDGPCLPELPEPELTRKSGPSSSVEDLCQGRLPDVRRPDVHLLQSNRGFGQRDLVEHSIVYYVYPMSSNSPDSTDSDRKSATVCVLSPITAFGFVIANGGPKAVSFVGIAKPSATENGQVAAIV